MYNTKKAANYWGQRIKNHDLKTAVLSLSFPEYLNDAYAQWESTTLKKEIGKIKNQTVLDVGCGGGRNSIPLAKMGAKITGVDISPQMLDFAKNNAKKNKCSKNTNFIQSNAWEIDLPSRSFDKILLLGILEHIPEEYRKKTIKEAQRLLKKGGELYVVINNKNSFFLKSVKKWKKPKQNISGYYSGLMNPSEILSYLKSLKLKPKSIQSNLHYSLLLHAVEKIDPNLISKNDQRFVSTFFSNLLQLDMINPSTKVLKNKDKLDDRFADQFFIIMKN